MCGICGELTLVDNPVRHDIERMTKALAHRGPDDEGVWLAGPVGLGHRRLSIIDLTETGHQPMHNEDGSLTIVYNGEVYNAEDLRRELVKAGHHFRGRSDTETVLHAYEEWGGCCLPKFNGIFAFAIWDQKAQRLFLACDRGGVKPLYYWTNGRRFLFASEVKAMLTHPEVTAQVDASAMDEYFTFQMLLGDRTLFKGVHLMPAGSWMELGHGNVIPKRALYWDVPVTKEPLKISFEEAVEETKRLFIQAVDRQMMSDVPIGSYLSGGIDSGSVVAAARWHQHRLCTFTGGFDTTGAQGRECRFDERRQAEEMARLCQTEHYEVVLHPDSMQMVLPDVIWHLEDLRNGQCYPRYYVARLASKFVKVILSGGGGDELFAGYPWRYYHGLNSTSAEEFYRNYYSFWSRLVPDDEKAACFRSDGRRRGHSSLPDFQGVFRNRDLPLDTVEDKLRACLYFEFKTFLRGLLIIEDKISMAHGLEARVPFLDNDLVDFAWRLPVSYKLDGLDQLGTVNMEAVKAGTLKTDAGKKVLRAALQKVMPSGAGERIKQGFSPPDANWYRIDPARYIQRTLGSPKHKLYQYLSHEYVTRKLAEHNAGTKDHRLLIWSLLSFEHWLRNFIKEQA